MIDAGAHHAVTILFVIGSGLAATGTGYTLLNKTGITFNDAGEAVFYSLGLGLAGMAYAVFILGILQAIYPTSIYALMAVFAVIGLMGCFRMKRQMPILGTWSPRSMQERLACFILAICLVALFLLELTPEIGKDALIYHLAVPKLFIQHHGFYFIEGNVFANYPLFGEMLYIIGLTLQNDILAKFIHFILLLAILLGTGVFIRRQTGAHALPFLGMLIFLSVPSVFITAHMAYNDLFVVYYSLGAFFAFISWTEKNGKGWLILCGLFSGLAVACKYTALLLPFLGTLGVLWNAQRRRLPARKAAGDFSIYAVCLVLAGCPFYIKNWIVTGNPVYPFLFSIFGGRGWDSDQARLYDIFVYSLGMGKEPLDYLLLPWNVSLRAKMDSPQFDGIVGPIFLLILPFALGLRRLPRATKIILIYCLCVLAFWAASAQQIRYLMLVLPLLSIVIVVILSYYREQQCKALSAVIFLLISVSLAYNFYYIARDFQKIRPLPVISGLENREDFLKRSIPSYGMYSFANRHLPNDAKIFSIFMKNYGFLCDRSFYADAMFESHTLQKILSSSHDSQQVRTALNKRGFTHIMYDANYVTGDWSTLAPREKELFAAFRNEYLTYLNEDRSYLLYQIK